MKQSSKVLKLILTPLLIDVCDFRHNETLYCLSCQAAGSVTECLINGEFKACKGHQVCLNFPKLLTKSFNFIHKLAICFKFNLLFHVL